MAELKQNQKYWGDVSEGEVLPRVTMHVPFAKVILNAAATNDYFPGHHDPEYARAQGQRNIYLNTMAIEGFIDRVATDWACSARSSASARCRCGPPFTPATPCMAKVW